MRCCGDPAAERNCYANPDRLTEFLPAHACRGTVVIAEMQRVPELLPLLHQHIELSKGRRFVLTRSSVRNLPRPGVGRPAGRRRRLRGVLGNSRGAEVIEEPATLSDSGDCPAPGDHPQCETDYVTVNKRPNGPWITAAPMNRVCLVATLFLILIVAPQACSWASLMPLPDRVPPAAAAPPPDPA